MTARGLWAIGCGQLVNWGVLYFAFCVLLVPLEQTLETPRWLVAGAFSLSLLVSAVAAPLTGRLADRGQGPMAMQAGGFVAAGLLIAWAIAPSLPMTYLVWSALGLCMAAMLYEPVFVMIGRAVTDAPARLRAIATVTVMGGLASTAFLPATSWLVEQLGWRYAVVALAVTLAAMTMVVGAVAFPGLSITRDAMRDVVQTAAGSSRVAATAGLTRLVAAFAASGFVNAAVASNLVAAFIDRGLSPALAASIGGLLGVMQLPGRLLMTHPAFTPGPYALLLSSFALQVAGLVALAMGGTGPSLWIGVTLFASGGGLSTLARPYLVLHTFGAERAGVMNGVIARGHQLARAAGPVSAAALAGVTGYGGVFVGLAILLVTALVLAPRRHPAALHM